MINTYLRNIIILYFNTNKKNKTCLKDNENRLLRGMLIVNMIFKN